MEKREAEKRKAADERHGGNNFEFRRDVEAAVGSGEGGGREKGGGRELETGGGSQMTSCCKQKDAAAERRAERSAETDR